MAILVKPATIVAAYSPVFVTTDTSSLTITADIGGVEKSVTLTHILKGGRAVFDIHEVLVGFIGLGEEDNYVDWDSDTGFSGSTEGWQHVKFWLDNDSSISYWAVNSAFDYSQNNNSLTLGNVPPILTHRKRNEDGQYLLPNYAGFYGGVTVRIWPSGDTEVIGSDGGVLTLTSEDDAVVNLPIVSEMDSYDVTYDKATWHNSSLILQEHCVPDNPVFATWLNQYGGMEYWMFDGKKVIGEAVTRGESYPIYRGFGTGNEKRELAPTIRKSIVVGAELLDKEDFELLKSLAGSPRIFLQTVKDVQKTPVLIADSNFTWDTALDKGSIEFEFELPSPDAQY